MLGSFPSPPRTFSGVKPHLLHHASELSSNRDERNQLTTHTRPGVKGEHVTAAVTRKIAWRQAILPVGNPRDCACRQARKLVQKSMVPVAVCWKLRQNDSEQRIMVSVWVLLLPRQKSRDLHDRLTYLGRTCHITSKRCHSSLQSRVDYPMRLETRSFSQSLPINSIFFTTLYTNHLP